MKTAYSVTEFCQENSISRTFFYDLEKRGLAPKSMKIGRRRLISTEAAIEWRRRMEAATVGAEESE